MPENTTTPRAALPEFLRSPMMGALVAAHLGEMAAAVGKNGHPEGEHHAGLTLTERAQQQMLQQASREITDYHTARNGGAR